ncbi:hypothetical protein LXH13_16815 [Streptomyces spinosirectus]|jgi:hypothetical protein|uniref:proline-rich domain-containing protein n=1 Tax=Streptomyces TaxID=1883 RepID=UPI000D34437F|nr:MULTISPECIES: proline-rich domain-containing protein [Streptomyces]MBY8340566.1 hypothetical protein [Streptomyces plumbidurans]PTM92500.1 hypothetical protein C7821_109322 [Streptomyces sp. VMFN-G11Ma]UIR18604.1 hypothetical protein LXH13_16815 [Streptomyces spinosirectus]
MSFGDPNNPYGPPQGQQQGYGHPQQQPQAPGYGYPQAPPMQQPYGAGAPMTTMPGTVNTARVLLWVIVGLQAVGLIFVALGLAAIDKAKDSTNDSTIQNMLGDSTGILWGYLIFALAWLVFAVVLAIKFKDGGNNFRVTTLVFAIITAVLGVYPFVLVGLIHTVLAILVAVFVGNATGKAWFNRPRY